RRERHARARGGLVPLGLGSELLSARDRVAAGFAVEATSSLAEFLRDGLAVLLGAVAAELELRANVGDGESQSADRAELLRIAVLARLDGRVLAFRLEMPELALEDLREGRVVVDRLDVARELHRRVVARRHAVLVLIPVPGDVCVRAEDREERARPLFDRLPHGVDAREMKEDGLVTVPDEVRRDDDRKVARWRAGDDEVAEIVGLEEVAPLGVGERLIVSVNKHRVNDERSGRRDLNSRLLGPRPSAL